MDTALLPADAAADRKRPAVPLDAVGRAEYFGLGASGARPPLRTYLRRIWSHRDFILSFATAQTIANYAHARLGQVWQLLTPLLNAAVYYLVFGKIMHTSRGIDHFMGYLVTGVFIFTYTQTAVVSGSHSINQRLDLIRALHFPRACLPLAFTIAQLQQLGVSVLVFMVVDVSDGAAPSWAWLQLIPALGLLTVFNAGLALIVARIGARQPDFNQLLPFLVRTWMYCSGVMYSISAEAAKHSEWVRTVFYINPLALFMEVTRTAMGVPANALPAYCWLQLAGWAAVVGAGGFVFFWRAEDQYGRG